VLKKLSGKLEVKNADDRRPIAVRKSVLLSPDFKALWDRIKHKTTYRVQFDNAKLIDDCIQALDEAPPIAKTRLQWKKADMAIGKAGVEASLRSVSEPIALYESGIELPDVLTELQDRTQLTRKTIARILTESIRLNDFKRNPQQFIDWRRTPSTAASVWPWSMASNMCAWATSTITRRRCSSRRSCPVTCGIWCSIPRNRFMSMWSRFADRAGFCGVLERNEAVRVYAKLPGWFKVPTPLGTYNPDWAMLVTRDGQERLYFVVETKGSLFDDELRAREGAKIKCGTAHFAALADEGPMRHAMFVPARLRMSLPGCRTGPMKVWDLRRRAHPRSHLRLLCVSSRSRGLARPWWRARARATWCSWATA
jgi:type III restriction enzyme